jgi:heme exporter protein D
MMPDLGKYAGPVLWSYAFGIGIVLILVALTIWQGARVKRTLAEAEARAGARSGGARDV